MTQPQPSSPPLTRRAKAHHTTAIYHKATSTIPIARPTRKHVPHSHHQERPSRVGAPLLDFRSRHGRRRRWIGCLASRRSAIWVGLSTLGTRVLGERLITGTFSDAFTKRETAAEEMYIKQEEKAK